MSQRPADSPIFTQKLIEKGKRLINNDFNKENINSMLSKYRTPVSSKKQHQVTKARQKIRQEWQNLKDATVLSDDSLHDVLHGTVVYIEVDSEEREIKALKSLLKKMGATVKETFTQEVTHIIFKNGSLETYKRAKLLNVHLVSTLWVDACRNSKTKVWENLFPTMDKNKYSNTPRAFRKFMEFYNTSNEQQETSLANILTDLKNLELNLGNRNRRSNSSENTSIHLHVSRSDSSDQTPDVSSKNQNPNEVSSSEETSPPEEQYPDNSTTSYNSTESISPNRRKLFTKFLKDQSFIRNSQQESTELVRRETIESLERPPPCKNPYKSNSGDKIIISPVKSKVTKRISPKKKKNEIDETVKKVIRVVTNEPPKQFVMPQFYTFSKLTQTQASSVSSKPALVSTSLHYHENKQLKDVVNRLGIFNFKAKVDHQTTHLITGDMSRTINLLKAVARGCWVLSKKWVEDSATAGQWLAEEQYEVVEFSKVVQRSRISKQHFGKKFKLNIFDDCGLIYLSRECTPSYKDLKELILLCGGKITSTLENAEIIIGPVEQSQVKCTTEKWVFDSITCGRVKYLGRYRLND